MLKQRRNSISHDDVDAQLKQFADACRRSPIAVVPEMANEQHYEVPAALFESVLGQRLKYSCCEWTDDVQTLDEAEVAALTTTCQRAELQDGMRILELGCGWGSLTLWMAENYPNSQITAVSNSTSQKAFIESRADALGISNVEVITADMNQFEAPSRYDRVVSVEMFEHMRNHEELLRRISHWLAPKGKLFVHIFCHREQAYLFEALDDRDWMSNHFFSGGMMPGYQLLPGYDRDLTVERQWAWNGRHYERTCNEWLQNQDENRDYLMSILSDTYGPDQSVVWFHRWRIFFMSCAELFGFRGGDEWFVAHYLFRRSNV